MLEIKDAGLLSLKAPIIQAKADGMAQVQSTGPLILKGGMVMIN